MRFMPKTKEELSNLLAEGEADFLVIEAFEGMSKAGNPQIVLTLKVQDKNGKAASFKDYIAIATEWKIRNFCYSAGLQDEYNQGEISAKECLSDNLTGKGKGKCIIKIKKGDNDGQGGVYPDKNVIANYIEKEESGILSSTPDKATCDSFFDDDIKF